MEEGNSGFSLYDLSQMKGATNGFSIENKLGQGGFGAVYKVFKSFIVMFRHQITSWLYLRTKRTVLTKYNIYLALSGPVA
jgi:hypothetical protein